MTRRSLLIALAAIAAPGCQEPRDAAQTAVEAAEAPKAPLVLPEHLQHDVDEYVASWGRHWPAFRFHGEITVSVGGNIQLERAFGFRDLAEERRHEGGTRFRLGTLSAHVAAATALALAKDGRLQLEAPVAEYVDEPRVPAVLTVEHLLTHTSGLPSFTDDLAFALTKRFPRSHAAIATDFASDPLEFEPGSDFAPSNSNSALLGLVIQRAAGEPFEDVARATVLEPLELESTQWGDAPDQAIGLVFNEAEHLEAPGQVDPRAFGASGGWSSTSHDLHRLYAAMGSARFGGEHAHLRWLGANAYTRPYAFVEVSVAGKEGFVWLGLIDGFNSAALLVPEDGLVVTVLGNSEVVPAADVAADIARLAFGLEVGERVEPRAVPTPAAELEAVTGQWVVTRGTEDMLLGSVPPETFDKLRRIQAEFNAADATLTLVVPGFSRKRMHPLGRGRFFFKDGPQSTAQLRPGTAGTKDVLVLERDGTSLRYVRSPVRVAVGDDP